MARTRARACRTEPYRFEEREAPGVQMLSASHSSGGNFVVMGDSAHLVHIYKLSATNVQRINEFSAHSVRFGRRFARHVPLSGSSRQLGVGISATQLRVGQQRRYRKDLEVGRRQLERHRVARQVSERARGRQRSRDETRVCSEPQTAVVVPTPTVGAFSSRRVNAYKVTMLNWTSDDEHLITVGTDFVVRVWDSNTGELRRSLVGHSAKTYCVCPHTIHSNLVFTAAHDGLIIVSAEARAAHGIIATCSFGTF